MKWPGNFQRHVATCQRGDQLVPVEPDPESDHDSLTTDGSDSDAVIVDRDENDLPAVAAPPVNVLEKYYLSLNLDLRLIICQTCRVGLKHSQVYYHLAHFHKYPKVNKSSLLENIDEAFNGPYDDSPYVTPGRNLVAPVPGLEVLKGFKCLECPYYVRTWRQLKQHYFDHHDEDDLIKANATCLVQKLFKSNSHYFGVDDVENGDQGNGPIVNQEAREKLYAILEPICKLFNPHSKRVLDLLQKMNRGIWTTLIMSLG